MFAIVAASLAGCEAPIVQPLHWAGAQLGHSTTAGEPVRSVQSRGPSVRFEGGGGRRAVTVSKSPAGSAANVNMRPSGAKAATPEIVAGDVGGKLNAFRQRHGQRPVRNNAALKKAAEQFAAYMAARDLFSHEADGGGPSRRAAAAGYHWSVVRENIAWAWSSDGYASAELAAHFDKSWQDSPSHRANMLAADVSDMGIGVARSKKTGKYYGVQLLGASSGR